MIGTTVTASAHLVAELVNGVTRCTTMRSAAPLTLRATPEGVYLVGSTAGPLGGDRLQLSVRVGAGATLVVRSAAATIALPGVTGGPSHLEIDLDVGAGGSLWWLPEPLVLVEGCDHRTSTWLRLGAGAALVLREEVVLGRFAECSGSLWQRLRVDTHDHPLLRNDLRLGPRWPGADGPAGVNGARAVAQTLYTGVYGAPVEQPGPGAASARGGTCSAVLPLRDGAVLVSEVMTDASRLALTRPRFDGEERPSFDLSPTPSAPDGYRAPRQ